jgi:hypothetical protein
VPRSLADERLPIGDLRPRAPRRLHDPARVPQTCPNLSVTIQVRVASRRCSGRGKCPYRSVAHRGRRAERFDRAPGSASLALRGGCTGDLEHSPRRPRLGRQRPRRELLREHQPDAATGQHRPDPHGGPLPDQPGTRSARRERAGAQREAHTRSAGTQRRHGQRGLLLARRSQRRIAAGPDARERLHLQRASRVRSRREHRLGHTLAREPAVDRQRLDGLAGAPREHPRRALPRNRRRRLPAPAGLDGRTTGRRSLHAGLRHDRHDRPRRAPPRPVFRTDRLGCEAIRAKHDAALPA